MKDDIGVNDFRPEDIKGPKWASVGSRGLVARGASFSLVGIHDVDLDGDEQLGPIDGSAPFSPDIFPELVESDISDIDNHITAVADLAHRLSAEEAQPRRRLADLLGSFAIYISNRRYNKRASQIAPRSFTKYTPDQEETLFSEGLTEDTIDWEAFSRSAAESSVTIEEPETLEVTETKTGRLHHAANLAKEKLSKISPRARFLGALAVYTAVVLTSPDSSNSKVMSQSFSNTNVAAESVFANTPSMDEVFTFGLNNNKYTVQPPPSMPENIVNQSGLPEPPAVAPQQPETQPEAVAPPALKPAETPIEPLVLAPGESVWQHVYDKVVGLGVNSEVDAINATADIVEAMRGLTGMDLDNLEVGLQPFGIPPELLKEKATK
jgi:hypothetical protein